MEILAMEKKDTEQEWQYFLNNIERYATDPPEKWTSYTFLAYFLVKYKEINGENFIFSATKRGPTHSRELKQATKIWEMFNKNRYKNIPTKEEKKFFKEQLVTILKQYIDWAFVVKFKGKNINITGLGIFAVPNFMNEFLQWRKNKKNLLPKRNENLPKHFIDWIQKTVPEIFNRQQLYVLEDLNMLKKIIEFNNLSNESQEKVVLNKAIEMNIFPKEGYLELRS